LSPEIVEHTTSRFREELEVIFDTIARRNSLQGKVPIFGLRTSTSMDEDIDSSTSWRARTVERSLKIPSHPTCRSVVKI
jgi:hypothetical protein